MNPNLCSDSFQQNLSSNFTIKPASSAVGVSIKPNPVIGKKSSLIQLEKFGFKPGDEFWIKTYSNGISNPYCAEVTENGFKAFPVEAKKDSTNKKLRDPKGGSVWIKKDSIRHDGYSFIKDLAKNNSNIFILPNHPKGGIGSGHATKFKFLFFECDDRSIEAQWQLLQYLSDECGIIPAMVIYSGGKSLHVYYELAQEITADEWKLLQRKAIFYFRSDRSIQNLNREMRFAGFPRNEKGTQQTLDFVSDYKYSAEELEQALETYALKTDCKPFSEDRYQLFQFIDTKLSIKADGHTYTHEKFNANTAQTCEDSEVSELHKRGQKWASLIRKRNAGQEDIEPESAWTEDLKKVREWVKKEYSPELIQAPINLSDPITVTLAKKYGQDFTEYGRSEYHTLRCPIHNGVSSDSLHIHAKTGRCYCQKHCHPSEIEKALRDAAKDADDPMWNWSDERLSQFIELKKLYPDGGVELTQVGDTIKAQFVSSEELKPGVIYQLPTHKNHKISESRWIVIAKNLKWSLVITTPDKARLLQNENVIALSLYKGARWGDGNCLKLALKIFAAKDREITLDGLSEDTTRWLGRALEREGCKVFIGKEKIALNNWEPELLNRLTIREGWNHVICEGKYTIDHVKSIPPDATVILKASMGVGKTWFIDQLINQVYPDSYVTGINPTVALSQTSGTRLRIDTREDWEKEQVGLHSVPRLNIVHPSLWKCIGRDYSSTHSILLLDEVRQGLQFLLQSGVVA